jgi:hypothetical protein
VLIAQYHFIKHTFKNVFSARHLLPCFYATKWRGGLIGWSLHGRGKESKVVQNMRYSSAIVLTRRYIAVSLPEGVGAEDGEVLGVA